MLECFGLDQVFGPVLGVVVEFLIEGKGRNLVLAPSGVVCLKGLCSELVQGIARVVGGAWGDAGGRLALKTAHCSRRQELSAPEVVAV